MFRCSGATDFSTLKISLHGRKRFFFLITNKELSNPSGESCGNDCKELKIIMMGHMAGGSLVSLVSLFKVCLIVPVESLDDECG